MASANQITAIIGGAIVLVAAAVGGTYVLLKPPPAKTVEAPAAAGSIPAPAPAPAAAAPALPAASAGVTSAVPDIATVEFTPTIAQYSVIRTTAVYLAPSTDAPRIYTLPPGLGVRITSQSKDGKWVIPVTANGQAAYLLTADLGPYQPGAMQALPLAPQTVTGPATVLDTGTLKVNDQRLAGETGVLADNLQDLITSNGGIVTCQPQAQAFVCTLANGTDVGRAALYNGAATPTADATPDYQSQTNAAKQAHRGLWQ
jgi:hypothetical protein